MRIVLIGEAGRHRADLVAGLAAEHEIVALPAEAAHTTDFTEALAPAEVVVSLRLTAAAALPATVRLFHVPGAGLDAVDFAAIAPETAVCNVYEHETPIAEYALAAILGWQVRLDAMRASFASTPWHELYSDRPRHGELYGKTVGVIGYGRVGRAVAERAAAFGVRVLAVDDYATGDGIVDPMPTARLHDMLSICDFVLVTCPLTDQTRGMIDARALSVMRGSAVLINVARAAIVDEDALYAALRDRAIGGAVLDVWYAYPRHRGDVVRPARHDFGALDNVWTTPHSSAWTEELSARRYAVIADNVNRLAAGEPLRNLVRAQGTGPT